MAVMKIRVKAFKRGEVRAGPVRIACLRRVYSDDRVERGDPWDVIAYTVEALSKNGGYDYVEIEVELLERGKGEEGIPDKLVRGEYVNKKFRGGKHLSHRPETLRRVGILYLEAMASKYSGGYVELSPEDIEWYDVGEEVYVYEGHVEVEEAEGKTPVYLLLETPSGVRWVRLVHGASLLRFPQQESAP